MPERPQLLDAEERLVDIADSADHMHTRDKSNIAWILITGDDVKALRAALELVRTELSEVA